MQIWGNINNRLSQKEISLFRANGVIGSEVIFYKELTSTFDKIRELTPKDGLTVVCASQTAGSGRLGRSWESSEGGIYLSFALVNIPPYISLPLVTPICALGVCKALQKYTDAKIKWPNDIVYRGKKLCGILTKSLISQKGAQAVYVGIGINVNNTFSQNLPYATSLKTVCGKEINENALLFEVLDSVDKVWSRGDIKAIMEEYRTVCVNIGKEVTLVKEDKEIRGVCTDISLSGELLFDTGEATLAVHSGEVSVKGIYSKEGNNQDEITDL